jgi:lipopolysaccharide/colanic/teichoic acid biosynthesis glycosyltransferase
MLGVPQAEVDAGFAALANPWNLALKRAFDLVVATATTALMAPGLALIALAIRLDSPVLARTIGAVMRRDGAY